MKSRVQLDIIRGTRTARAPTDLRPRSRLSSSNFSCNEPRLATRLPTSARDSRAERRSPAPRPARAERARSVARSTKGHTGHPRANAACESRMNTPQRPTRTDRESHRAQRCTVAAWARGSRRQGCGRRTRGRAHRRRIGTAKNQAGLRGSQLSPFRRTLTIPFAAARHHRQLRVIRMSLGRRFLASMQSGLVGSTCRPTLSAIARPACRDPADRHHELQLAARTRCHSPCAMQDQT